MTFEEYKNKSKKYMTNSANNYEYLFLGLIEEIGEVSGKIAKRKRDNVFDVNLFLNELGDVLWFVANIAEKSQIKIDLAKCSILVNRNETLAIFRMSECAVSAINLISAAIDLEDLKYLKPASELLAEIIVIVSEISKKHASNLEEIEFLNLSKLEDRKNRNVINGNGDKR